MPRRFAFLSLLAISPFSLLAGGLPNFIYKKWVYLPHSNPLTSKGLSISIASDKISPKWKSEFSAVASSKITPKNTKNQGLQRFYQALEGAITPTPPQLPDF
jgi:hypothetical protein